MRPSSNHHHSGYGSGNHHGSRNSNGMTGSNDFFGHDPMTAINNFDHDRHQSSLSNLPIPVGKLHYCLFFSNLFSSFPVSNFHDEKLVKIATRAPMGFTPPRPWAVKVIAALVVILTSFLSWKLRTRNYRIDS